MPQSGTVVRQRTMSGLVRERVARRGVRYVTPVSPARATGLVAAVYDQMRREFAIVPPLTLHSPIPELLAGVWAVTREAYVVDPAGRAQREALATAVSQANSCPFCVEVHSIMARAAGGMIPAEASASVFPLDPPSSADPLVAWGGATRSPRLLREHPQPFPDAKVPAMYGTAVLFHYINRMVNVFLEPSPMPAAVRFARAVVGRVVAMTVGRGLVRVDARPGLAVGLEEGAVAPPEFGWAAAAPPVARALATLASASAQAGEATLPGAVRELARETLARWEGDDPGLGRAWLDAAVAALASARERAAAVLVLLTALASYRVDAAVVGSFRTHFPDDRDLVAATAWTSFEATRRIASWLGAAGGA